MDVIRVSDLEQLTSTAAADFITYISEVQANGGIHGDGIARVVLTGGGAGIGTLRKLAELDHSAKQQAASFPIAAVDWSRVHVFFGDERAVPVTDPESNEGQAREALLDHVAINLDWIHSYRLGELSLEQSAAWYAEELERWAPKGFDLHLLGMGGEGHINSLFPHSEAVREENKMVIAVQDSPKPPATRVSLTLPAIRRATEVWLLVAGAEKAEAAGHVIAESDFVDWPAAGAQGTKETRLFLAADATP